MKWAKGGNAKVKRDPPAPQRGWRLGWGWKIRAGLVGQYTPQGGWAGLVRKISRYEEKPLQKNFPSLQPGEGWTPFWYPPPRSWQP